MQMSFMRFFSRGSLAPRGAKFSLKDSKESVMQSSFRNTALGPARHILTIPFLS